jgi:hypothetical protein
MNMPLDLSPYHNGDDYYRHWTGRLIYTAGVKALADQAGAYWLIDAIASYQTHRRVVGNPRLREFQLWELAANEDGTAFLTLCEDTGCPPVIQQNIEYTDFPRPGIKLFVESGTLLLPQEH